jgi:hypothetical protein
MDQMTKMQLKARMNATNGLIGAAKGLSSLPAIPNMPNQALVPLVAALQDLSKTIEILIDKS